MMRKTKVDDSTPDFADVVSMQGLRPILDPKSGCFRKFVWLMVLLLALAFTSYNITNQVMIHLGYPIKVIMDIRRASELPFPAITICNFNFVSKLSAKEFDKPVLPMVAAMKPFPFSDVNYDQSYKDINFTGFHAPGKWEGLYRTLGHSSSSSLLKCRWEIEPCTPDNFTNAFTDFGVCFVFNFACWEIFDWLYDYNALELNALLLNGSWNTFGNKRIFANMDGHLKARNSGRDYGVKFTLTADQDNYFRSFARHYGAGFKISIHPNGVPPNLGESGISISPGFHTSLAVSVRKMKNAPVSVSKCGSKPLKYYVDKPYSMEACRLECMTEFVVKQCGCREIYMPGNDTLICDPPVLFSCMHPKIAEYLTSSDKGCEISCPEPCSAIIYDTMPSAAVFSDVFVEEYSNYTEQDVDFVRKNLVEVEIYLTSMFYGYVEKQMSYTWMDLMCDIGGALGLLLGASFLTLLEILDFFLFKQNKTKPMQIQVKPKDIGQRF